MNFDRRLARVERILGEAGACPLCRGEGGGPQIVACRWDEPRPKLPGCEACGKRHARETRIIVVDDRDIVAPEKP